jgi:parallel beta-helix repeat protein
MVRKWLVVGIIVLFVGTSIVPAIAQDMVKPLPTSRGNWLYVGGSGPGNYTRIQDAMDNASDGDTVFVYDDSSPYLENLFISKSIHLCGEEKETTIIDAGSHGDGILLTADNITISGLTIANSDRYHKAINMSNSNYSTIYGNILKNNIGWGMLIWTSANNNMITENSIMNNYGGILISNNFGNTITNNSIIYNKNEGITVGSHSNNTIIRNNTISSNGVHGIYIGWWPEYKSNLITGNYISNHSKGIILSGVSNVIVSNNTVVDNGIGIEIDGISNIIINNYIEKNSECGLYNDISSSDNIISNNSFLKNGILNFDPNHNQFYNNTVNGRPFILLKTSTGTEIENAGQIILVDCNHIIIKNQNLYQATCGLMLYNTNDCTISKNNFSYNNVGVYLSYSTRNNFIENNFIQNERDVSFIINYLEIHNNRWERNYFNKKISFLPKIIRGTVETRYKFHFGGQESPIYRIGFNFDWHPAQEPYDIPGMR